MSQMLLESVLNLIHQMVLYMVGLGLGSPQDITVRGMKAIKSSDEVYLEYYTSIMGVNNKELSQFLGRELIEADRDFCEVQIDKLLERMAKQPKLNVSFLVVGDPFCATTHSDLYLRAIKLGIPVEVIHNASIVSAVGCTGLQVYRFGQIISLPFFTEKWRPDSFYDKILANKKSGLHTLVLVDIKVKERSEENIMRDKKIYQPPRFMTVKQCVEQLLEIESKRQQGAYDENSKCFGLARIGFSTQLIRAAPMKQFLEIDMGLPLHSLVICGQKLHCMQQQMYDHFLKKTTP